MFLKTLVNALGSKQCSFNGKLTLAKLQRMPIETIEDRFGLLLEIATYSNSLGIDVLVDGTTAIPNLNKITRLIAESNSLSHIKAVVANNMKQIMQELSFEIIEATNNNYKFDNIIEIYNGEIPMSEFLNIPKETNKFNKVYSLKGISGKDYNGVGIGDIASLKGEELIDIISGLKFEGDEEEIRKYILNEKDILKNEFRSHRTAMLAYVKFLTFEELESSKIINFAKEKLNIVSEETTPEDDKGDNKAQKNTENNGTQDGLEF